MIKGRHYEHKMNPGSPADFPEGYTAPRNTCESVVFHKYR